MRRADHPDWQWILGGVAVLYLFRDSLGSVGAKIGAGVTEIITGLTSGIGQGINAGIIDPAVAAMTGQPGNTAGAAVWDALNTTSVPADIAAIFPNAARMNYNGDIYTADGSLIGYVTDEFTVRDFAGRAVGQSGMLAVIVHNSGWFASRWELPNFQNIVNGV